MFKKILLLIISLSMLLSAWGCTKKINTSGDPELDAARKEMEEAIKEANETVATDTNVTDSTNIKINEVYMVEVQGSKYIVVYCTNKLPFDKDDMITVTGYRDGLEEQVKNAYMSDCEIDSINSNFLKIPIDNSDNNYVFRFIVRGGEYSSYELLLRDTKSKPLSDPITLNQHTYTIEAEDIQTLSHEEFMAKKTQDVIKSSEELSSFDYRSLKLDYLGASFSGDTINYSFTITNTGSSSSEEYELSTILYSKDGISKNVFVNNNSPMIPILAPGETIDISFPGTIHNKGDKFNINKGDDFLFRFDITPSNSITTDLFYFSSKF
ncbi:hypothetical protein [Clostridium sp.]|uniref:hypothetical protein n=1 Tax=Clostridium sp. TaxID=1506 RepID=UPI001D463A05|nr:hypothetical protein [Clostridium sp.]MBS5938590.1 hypothetical protein [Clostridium sp.]